MSEIVLVGGGHAHVQVMTAFGRRPEPGTRLTLVTDQLGSPYSGMLPGHLAGLYRRDEMQIDIAALAAATGTRLIQARVTGLDAAGRRLLCDGREPVRYALASLNIGIVPDLSGIAGAAEHAVPVKPIASFLARFDMMMAALPAPQTPCRLAIVGNGAAGVELAFALHARLQRDRQACEIVLIGAGPPVAGLNDGIRSRVRAALARRGIASLEGRRVVAALERRLVFADGAGLDIDGALISTRARAPEWLAETGLALAQDGTIVTSPTLQVLGRDDLFAVGDCATIEGYPRQKAGVFAVRQGPVVAENLRRYRRGEPLARHHPQSRYLVLLGTGDGRAIGGRGDSLAFEGRWAWWLKDWIDRRFMARFAPRP